MALRSPLDIHDEVVRLHVENLQSEKQGALLELSASPTADEPLLLDKEIGVYSGSIYWRFGSSIYRIDPDATITIT